MFYIDDIQKSIAKNEGEFTKALAYRLSSPSKTTTMVFSNKEVFALMEGMQTKVFALLLAYYMEDNGVGALAKEQIFAQTLDQMDQKGVLENNTVFMKAKSIEDHIDIDKSTQDDILRSLKDDMLRQTSKTNKDLYKQMQRFDDDALLEVMDTLLGASSSPSTLGDKALFGGYIEKTLTEVLEACRRYEKRLASVTQKPEEALSSKERVLLTPLKPKMP